MLVVGIFADILEFGSLFLWIFKGIWWPFVAMLPIVAVIATVLVKFYYKNVAYTCPECDTTFKPNKKEFFFARHTFKTRKLTCTHCGYKGYCVEVADPTRAE